VRASLRDPGARAVAVLIAAAAAGFVALGLAWRGLAATLDVWVQLPFVVSGGFGGVALTGTALALLDIHLSRRSAAAERVALEELLAALSALTEEEA
jgi:hypothetical protein